jgi:cyclophilin family peptidyl-prolyl cis-trans isomerase
MPQGLLAIFLLLTAGFHFVGTSTSSDRPAGTSTGQPYSEESPKETVKVGSYTSPPPMTIDIAKSYQAVVHTNKGDFTIELFAQTAPKTVNNFVFLSKQGFYENVIFHRIIQSFMIQTGDPTGSGSGGPGYAFEDELNSNKVHQYEPGIIAMANAGPNTNGSQFFICTGEDSKNLNKVPNYTIFGKITDGMDTVLTIANTKVDQHEKTQERSHPMEQIVIQSVQIIEKDREK